MEQLNIYLHGQVLQEARDGHLEPTSPAISSSNFWSSFRSCSAESPAVAKEMIDVEVRKLLELKGFPQP